MQPRIVSSDCERCPAEQADHRLAVLPHPGYAAGQRFKGE
jgi:hypothetical protein